MEDFENFGYEERDKVMIFLHDCNESLHQTHFKACTENLKGQMCTVLFGINVKL